MIHDLVIIGAGPAGVAGGVYAARKKLNTVFITDDWGGQSIVSPEIQNWIGTISISGETLAKQLKDHLFSYQGDQLEVIDKIRVTKIEKEDKKFLIKTNDGKAYQALTVLIATGAHRRKLQIPGANEFDQKGVTYCASCDAPLFAGKEVAVIGGGNAGFETASQLLAYATQVTLLHHGPEFKADQITIDRVLSNPKITAFKNAETIEIKGDKFARSLTYHQKETGETKNLNVEGIFVEIGFIPTTDFVKNLIELNQYGSIIVDHQTQQSSLAGIWAAGDCTDGLYHQNNIAAGDAIKAVENIYNYLRLGKK